MKDSRSLQINNFQSFAFKQAGEYARNKKIIKALARFLCPVHYTRYRELPITLDLLELNAQDRVLDISSPKLFTLYCACKYKNQIYATDIINEPLEEAEFFKKKWSLNNLVVQKADARELPYEDNYFDKVFSVSVFEHIAPANKGDYPAVLEFSRVLKPGGIAVLTLAFANKYFEEYKKGTVYERESKKEELNFFQRFYDEEKLDENILKPSGLEILDKIYIGEKIYNDSAGSILANYINSGRLQNMLFGHFQRLAAGLFLQESRELEKIRKPIIVCLKLKKSINN